MVSYVQATDDHSMTTVIQISTVSNKYQQNQIHSNPCTIKLPTVKSYPCKYQGSNNTYRLRYPLNQETQIQRDS